MQVDDDVSDSGSYTAMENTTEPLLIGKQIGSSGSTFANGLMDEVAIFDKELKADQIKFDIYRASATANKSADFINNPILPTPVAWYRMGD